MTYTRAECGGYTTGIDALPLRTLRERRGLSQDELARRAGVSTKTVWSVENGGRRPHPRNRLAIATALGVEIAQVAEFNGGAGVEQEHDRPD